MLKLAYAAAFFFLSQYTIVAQTTLFFQNGNPGDNWSFQSTGADATALAESESPLNFTSAPRSLVVGGNTAGGSCIDGGTGNGPNTPRTFTFDPVDISSSQQFSRTLTFNWGNRHPICTGTGWDNGENLVFTPVHDGVSQAPITLAVGGNDAVFSIQSNTCTYTIPPCVNTFSFVLSITTNRRDELLFLDDVLLTTPGFNTPITPVEIALEICPSALPFDWNGQNITEAGFYEATINNSLGCDSLIHLNLSLSQEFTQNVSIQVCNQDYPIDYNGQIISEPGTYIQNLTSAGGCDSTVVVEISTLPSYFYSENVRICETELPYSYQGQTFSTEGDYTIPFTTSAGCDSTYFLSLSVDEAPVVQLNFNSTTFELDNTLLIITNSSDQYSGWFWSVPGIDPQFSIDSVFSPEIVLPNVPGSYEIEWTIINGSCVNTTSYFFIVLEPEFLWDINLPNVFSPNNDGVNDILTFDYLSAELVNLFIVNRWGDTVFETDDENEFWNGQNINSGDNCPEGIYFYQIKLRGPNQEVRTFQQFVHLVRQ
jgi:gliding motility-associated-like protein